MLFRLTLTSVIAAAFLARPLFVQVVAANVHSDMPVTKQVPAGTVLMGADNGDLAAGADEFPQISRVIDQPFEMGATPVTRRQYAVFAEATGIKPKTGCWTLTAEGWRIDPQSNWQVPGFAQDDDHPVVCVTREDAMAYAAWLSASTGHRYSLPTEAQWVHAAGPSALGRASEDLCTHGNINDLTAKNKVAKVAEHCDDGYLNTSPVAQFTANEFGLFDMIGNVWEWTADCHNGGFAAPLDDAADAEGHCPAFALRGHSWTDPPGPVRLGTRYALPADARQSIVGFRVVKASVDEQP